MMLSLERLMAEDGIALKGAGSNRLAKCPFHEDRTPSLSVDVEKNVWCCHGCGKEGGVKDWLIEKRLMSESEAARMIRTGDGAGAPAARAAPEPKPIYKGLPKKRQAVHAYRDDAGKLLFAVVRNVPGSRSKCTQWTPVHKDGTRVGWRAEGLAAKVIRPLYMLGALKKGRAKYPKKQVTIVEGEKCAERFQAAFPAALVTCWAGGSNAPLERNDWTPVHGAPILLLADEDDVGRAVMTKLAALLAPHCPIRTVLPEGQTHDGPDDWIARLGKDEARAKIAALIRTPPAPAGKDKKAEEKKPPPKTTGLLPNGHFRILGNIGANVAVLLSTYQMLSLSRTSLCQSSTLVSLADYHWWLLKTGRDSLSTATCQDVGSALIRAADDIGQIDPNRFLGRGAFRHEGDVAWHMGDRLLVAGKTHDLGDLPGVVPMAGPRIAIHGTLASAAERQRVAQAVLRYRWEGPNHGKRFMGWLVSSVVGGALAWRPHMWLSAAAATGKTWLIGHIMKPILGSMLIDTADPTAAGLARVVRSDSIAVAFDEAEATQAHVEQVLDYARIAAGGGASRIRAEQGSADGFQLQRPRFSLLMSSVTVTRLSQANASRFCSVRLSSAGVAHWPEVRDELEAALAQPERLLAGIVHDAKHIVDSAREMEQGLVADAVVGSRRAAIEAALTVGWEWWCGSIEPIMDDGDEEEQREAAEAADAVELLRYLLGLRLREGVHDASVARVLREGDKRQVALDYGFRIRAGNSLVVAPRHPSLLVKLLRSKWAGVDVRRTLLQLDGVEEPEHAVRFGAVRTRVVSVSKEICDNLGIALFDRPESDEVALPYGTDDA